MVAGVLGGSISSPVHATGRWSWTERSGEVRLTTRSSFEPRIAGFGTGGFFS